MRFLFINVQGEIKFYSRKKSGVEVSAPFAPPLGLLSLAQILRNEGHTVSVLEYFIESNPKDQIKQKLNSVDAVGLSMSTAWRTDAADVATFIKQQNPSIPVLIGGPHCILHPDKMMQEIKNADIGVEGEAEPIIKDLVLALEGKKPYSEIPGVRYRTPDQEIRHGPPAQLTTDLDALPFPARDLVEQYEYGKMKNTYLFKPRLTSILTSRGCPFRCRFCARYADPYKTYRQRSAENVVAEILEIQEKYRTLYVADENFLTDVKRAHKIMDLLIKNKGDLDIIIYGTRVDSAERGLYQKMKKAGVTHITYGIESGNQDILDFYNKQITLEQIRNAVQLSNEMNFITTGQFILGAPNETKEQIQRTIDFACSLLLDMAIFFPLYYMHSSDLYREAIEKGLIHQDKDEYSVVSDSRRGLGNFTQQELEQFCSQAVKRFYYRPRYLLWEFYKSILRRDFRILRTGITQ